MLKEKLNACLNFKKQNISILETIHLVTFLPNLGWTKLRSCATYSACNLFLPNNPSRTSYFSVHKDTCCLPLVSCVSFHCVKVQGDCKNTENKSRWYSAHVRQWNTGWPEAYFPQRSGWAPLPHHMLSTVVWAARHGACRSGFFHPDKNRWGQRAARYTWSRQNRKGASTRRGPRGRRTLQFHLHLSSAHTRNKRIWI